MPRDQLEYSAYDKKWPFMESIIQKSIETEQIMNANFVDYMIQGYHGGDYSLLTSDTLGYVGYFYTSYEFRYNIWMQLMMEK